MDYFTKWPEAYAMPNQLKNCTCRFGIPFLLHSDQGTNFAFAVFTGLYINYVTQKRLEQHLCTYSQTEWYEG